MDYIKKKRDWMPYQEFENILLTRNQRQQCSFVRMPGDLHDIEIELPHIATENKLAEEKCVINSIGHSNKTVAQQSNNFHNFLMKFLLSYRMFKFELDVESRQ